MGQRVELIPLPKFQQGDWVYEARKEKPMTVDFMKPVQIYSIATDEWTDVEVLEVTSKTVRFKREGARAGEVQLIDYIWFRNKPVSRAVPKDKRLDLTKPLEGVREDGTVFSIYLAGGIDPDSRNFPSWFIVEDDTSSKEDRFFLMRGDGKTDIPGVTVRNKMVETKPKLVLPLEVGKKYRMKLGSCKPHSFPDDGIGVLKYTVHGDYRLNGMHVDKWTGKHQYELGFDVVEGPL